MIFQALDSKSECLGIFANNEIYLDDIPWDSLTSTWRYSPSLGELRGKLTYAYIACGGKNLGEVCPPSLLDEWEVVENKMKAFLRSFMLSRISLDEHCFFDLVPEQFLRDYYKIRNLIIQHVLENYELQPNSKFLSSVHEMLEDIGSYKLNLNSEILKENFHQMKTRNFYKKLIKLRPNVRYNLFGSKTGRLTTIKNTFPVLTLDKDHRNVLKPNNDLFIELDYNGAELRTLLALSGKEQPEEDIHIWNVENVARGMTTRNEMKERFFAWLYNPKSSDTMIERFYDKEVVGDFWDGEKVTTPYARVIKSDEHHSLNYLIQSTTNDIALENAVAIHNYLSDKKTKIAFIVHDSIVLDCAADEKHHLATIAKMFEETRFGNFYVRMRGGKNYGNLKEISWR